MKTCVDEGTLQAYLDGELNPETSKGVASHLASCAACAAATREAEGELALFATVYAPASPISVPTEKLRARLADAIAEMQPQQIAPPAPSRLHTFLNSLIASLPTFAPRQAAAFASLLVAVALAIVFVAMQSPDNPPQVARVDEPAVPAATAARVPDNSPQIEISSHQAPVKVVSRPAAKNNRRAVFNQAKYETAGNVRTAAKRAVQVEGENTAGAATTAPVLADEKTYLTSIASLTSAIETQGPQGLTPTLRAEYERNLAVVNQAIVASRVAARRNPEDTDAKDFLRAAYQNKVELLSAIADQAEIASSRD